MVFTKYDISTIYLGKKKWKLKILKTKALKKSIWPCMYDICAYIKQAASDSNKRKPSLEKQKTKTNDGRESGGDERN